MSVKYDVKHVESSATNQPKLIISLVPVAILAALCLYAIAQRAVKSLLPEPSASNFNAVEARKEAQKICTAFSGTPADVVDAEYVLAFSHRRKEALYIWEVVCSVDNQRYLIRINGSTGRVFSVNQLNIDSVVPSQSTPMPRAQAEVYAYRYLDILGEEPRMTSSKQMSPAYHENNANLSLWSFNYRKHTTGTGQGFAKIALDATTGVLQNAWIPRYSL